MSQSEDRPVRRDATTQSDAGSSPDAGPGKRAYQKPELSVERVYETSALSCQKVNALGGCPNPLFQKFS